MTFVASYDFVTTCPGAVSLPGRNFIKVTMKCSVKRDLTDEFTLPPANDVLEDWLREFFSGGGAKCCAIKNLLVHVG